MHGVLVKICRLSWFNPFLFLVFTQNSIGLFILRTASLFLLSASTKSELHILYTVCDPL